MRPARVSLLKEAFDRHATEYDALFSDSPVAREMRERTWNTMDRVFSPGNHVLDLGCGTGEDALHLARRGVHVYAVDLSSAMVDLVRKKAEQESLGDWISCWSGDGRDIDVAQKSFDGILSNFGALNCVADIDWLGALATATLKPGARVVLVLMSPFYPLEWTVNTLKGRFGAASRRFGARSPAVVGGVEFEVHYRSLRTLLQTLGSGLELEEVEALNLLMPVPGLEHLSHRFPGLFRTLKPIDRWLSHVSPASGWGDHFMSVWRVR